MSVIIQIIIALLIAGFVLWAGRLLISVVPMDAMFAKVVDVLILILVGAIILFMVVIPLLNMLAGIHINMPVLSH